MHNPIVNYGRFPTIVSVQCLEHKQLSRILDALTNVHQWPRLGKQKLSWRASRMFRTGPPPIQAGVQVSSERGAAVVSRAPRGHSPHRRVAPAPPDGVRARWQPGQPRVYKAITACPGSWIIRVQADIMKVGCVLCVRVLQLHYCRIFTMQCWVSDELCQRAFTSFLLAPCCHKTLTIWSGLNPSSPRRQWQVCSDDCRVHDAEYICPHSKNTLWCYCGHWLLYWKNEIKIRKQTKHHKQSVQWKD